MYSDNILARKRSVDSSEFTQLKISTPHAGSIYSAICTVVDTVQFVTFTHACSSVLTFGSSHRTKMTKIHVESFEAVTQPAGRLAGRPPQCDSPVVPV